MGDTQMMNKMELPMSIFVSATSREDSDPDDDSDLQAAAFFSLRVVTMVVTVTTTNTTPGRTNPYTIESRRVMNSWITRTKTIMMASLVQARPNTFTHLCKTDFHSTRLTDICTFCNSFW